jgi:hypothetical protein
MTIIHEEGQILLPDNGFDSKPGRGRSVTMTTGTNPPDPLTGGCTSGAWGD